MITTFLTFLNTACFQSYIDFFVNFFYNLMVMNECSKKYLQSFKLYIEVERNFSKHTVVAYSSDILSFLIWLNDKNVEDVVYETLREYLVYIQQFNY